MEMRSGFFFAWMDISHQRDYSVSSHLFSNEGIYEAVSSSISGFSMFASLCLSGSHVAVCLLPAGHSTGSSADSTAFLVTSVFLQVNSYNDLWKWVSIVRFIWWVSGFLFVTEGSAAAKPQHLHPQKNGRFCSVNTHQKISLHPTNTMRCACHKRWLGGGFLSSERGGFANPGGVWFLLSALVQSGLALQIFRWALLLQTEERTFNTLIQHALKSTLLNIQPVS